MSDLKGTIIKLQKELEELEKKVEQQDEVTQEALAEVGRNYLAEKRRKQESDGGKKKVTFGDILMQMVENKRKIAEAQLGIIDDELKREV